MRIRNYLTIIVLVCLFGAYMIEFVLGSKRDDVQAFAARHHENQFAAMDFQYLQKNISQLLISVDLVLGSNETYLVPGAIEQTNLLIEQLEKLSSSAPIVEKNEVLLSITKDVVNIHNLLIETNKPNQLTQLEKMASLLGKYDESSIKLVNNLEIVSRMISVGLKDEALILSKLKDDSVYMEKISVFVFSILVFFLWYWANRQISNPLQTLSKMATEVTVKGHFDGIEKGPEEVLMLSNELSIITNSLIHQANHDPLTKLFNRREFERQLLQALEKTSRERGNTFNTVCYIDLDRFKIINDTCGHSAGDDMLSKVAEILSENARLVDVVARVGGDEFTILLKDCNISSAKELGQRLLKKIENIRYKWGENEFRISASIGLTSINGHEENIQEIINAADSACRIAKESGRNQIQILNIDDDRVKHKRSELLQLNQIINAIDESRLVLHHQDIVPLNNTKETGKHYEILIRMKTEDGQLVSPIHFLPIIERYNLSSRLDKWVVNETITLLIQNPKELDKLELCSINLSGQSLSSQSFRQFVVDLLQKTQFPGSKLCFEITETAAISDIELATSFISELRKYRVRFALDDFGTGHSSFEYLKSLPVDYIKIDGSFVKDMLKDPGDMATVKSITEVGRATGKNIIAEYVHSKEIADYLKTIGVDYALKKSQQLIKIRYLAARKPWQ